MKEVELTFKMFRKMNERIFAKNTGTPAEFARAMGCCTHTLYNHIKELNRMLRPFGVDCHYNKLIESYQYSVPGRFEIGCNFIRE
jgi:hypothetical protein